MRHDFPMPKVYSYTRFSTPEQAAGDSQRRQAEAARRFAAEQGLELDEALSISDLGVSAYRGANLEADAGLGRFMEAVTLGLVEPGSILLLESLDRFSRAEPLDVQHELTGLLRKGVKVATVSDGKVYSRETLAADNGLGLMIALMVSIRANEESATKGKRVAAAWAEKRRRVRAGQSAVLTARAPSWLKRQGDGWQIDEGKADTIRRIFALTLAGEGEHKIAERFNREAVPVFERGRIWHRSSVAKVLRNRAVIGELVPGRISYADGKRRRVTEDPIAGAFPPIISEADWLAVRSLKDGHAPAVRGRGAKAPLSNMLAGLARCPVCASAMTRVSKGSTAKVGRPKLVCTKAKAGAGCVYHGVPVQIVHDALSRNAGWIVDSIPAGGAEAELDAQALRLQNNIDGTVEHMADLADALEASPSKAGAVRLARLEAELGTLQAELEAVEERRAVVDGGLVRARAARLYSLLADYDGGPLEPINAAMRILFESVTVEYRRGTLIFAWRHGGTSPLPYSLPPAV